MKNLFLLVGRSLIALLLVISVYYQSANAQTIIIDSTFTSDAEIFLFGPNDTIYGLGITASIREEQLIFWQK